MILREGIKLDVIEMQGIKFLKSMKLEFVIQFCIICKLLSTTDPVITDNNPGPLTDSTQLCYAY